MQIIVVVAAVVVVVVVKSFFFKMVSHEKLPQIVSRKKLKTFFAKKVNGGRVEAAKAGGGTSSEL